MDSFHTCHHRHESCDFTPGGLAKPRGKRDAAADLTGAAAQKKATGKRAKLNKLASFTASWATRARKDHREACQEEECALEQKERQVPPPNPAESNTC